MDTDPSSDTPRGDPLMTQALQFAYDLACASDEWTRSRPLSMQEFGSVAELVFSGAYYTMDDPSDATANKREGLRENSQVVKTGWGPLDAVRRVWKSLVSLAFRPSCASEEFGIVAEVGFVWRLLYDGWPSRR